MEWISKENSESVTELR